MDQFRGPSWWHMHHSSKVDSGKEDPGKEDPGRLVRPTDWSLLSPLTFPFLVGGNLLVPCSYPGPPVVR